MALPALGHFFTDSWIKRSSKPDAGIFETSAMLCRVWMMKREVMTKAQMLARKEGKGRSYASLWLTWCDCNPGFHDVQQVGVIVDG